MDFHSQEENSLLEFLHSGKRFLIITGKVNSGKTSTVEKIISFLKESGKKVGGVYAKGIFQAGEKSGFEIVDIKSGYTKQIASVKSDSTFDFKQGRYFFNLEVFKEYNQTLSNSFDCEVIIFDEIGPIELLGKGFHSAVLSLLKNFNGRLIFVIRESLVEEVISMFGISLEEIDLFKAKKKDEKEKIQSP